MRKGAKALSCSSSARPRLVSSSAATKDEASAEAATAIAADVWTLLGLAPEQLGTIREEAELNLAAYLALFFPR